MQNTKTFILKAAISSLLVLSTMSLADTQKVENTPFVSGQSLKKGFFWYNDKDPVNTGISENEGGLSGY
ncbi:TPA: hypothetical protein ACPUOP_004717 [Klebsiella pneumoniae]